MAKSTIQQLFDAGLQFTDVSRKQAESLVKKLVKAGDVRKRDAESMVNQLVERGRDTSERVALQIQREVAKQVGMMSERFDEMEDRFEDLADRLAAGVNAKTSAAKPKLLSGEASLMYASAVPS